MSKRRKAAPVPPAGFELVETPWGERLFQKIEPTCAIEGGLIGYFMWVDGACLEAAVATVLQRPLESIPPLRSGWELHIWADSEGLEYERLDGPQFGSLSIGVTATQPYGAAEQDHYDTDRAAHTLVLDGENLVFNPASRFMRLDGMPASTLSGTPRCPIVETITLKERN